MPDEVAPDWYAGFFTELPNEFWRRAVPPEATAAEVSFVEDRLGLRPGSRVLDVPCGSGRHALALAARGHRVTGVDISEEAIAHARAAAAAAGLDVELRVAEMRAIPRRPPFDAAVCMGNSFGYLDLPGTRELLAALASAVRPGGGLAIDYNAAAESVLPGFRPEPRTMRAGDIEVVAESEYDAAGSRLISRYRFLRGDEDLAVSAIHHVLTSAQIGHLLAEAGFGRVERHAGPAGEPFALGSPRLIVTARRLGDRA